MSVVIHAVFARRRGLANVKVVIGQYQMSATLVCQELAVEVHGGIEAFLENCFGLRCGRSQLQNTQWAEFWNQRVKEREKVIPKAGRLIILPPLSFVTGSGEVIKKLFFG